MVGFIVISVYTVMTKSYCRNILGGRYSSFLLWHTPDENCLKRRNDTKAGY